MAVVSSSSVPPTRRDVLRTAAAVGALGLAARDALAGGEAPAVPRAPAAFVGHGSPLSTLDPARGGEWRRWASSFPTPRAILVVSAHFERAPATLGATTPVPPIHDFRGFPRALYALRYSPPGAPHLASRVEGLLSPAFPVRRDPARGLDHGAWCPLRWLAPRADVPTLSLSLPTQDPAGLFRLGRALAPLRDEGVLVLGSGNLVHNLRALGAEGSPVPAWASEFDAWCAGALARRDVDALLDWRRRAPAPARAHPTAEHLTPLFVVLGAGAEERGAVRFPVTGFEAGSVSRRCVQIG
jgi:4,5-DOPA dioxygenase extradiol